MAIASQYPLESADPDCLDFADAAELLREAPWKRLVVVGDSIAAGIREPVDGYRDAGFADRVGEALGEAWKDFAYRNLGVRGALLAEIVERQLPVALAFEPDLAIVVGGGNDSVHPSYDPDVVRRELKAACALLAEAGAQVVTIGLFDLARSGLVQAEYAAMLTDRFDRLDTITAEVAAEIGAIHIDTHHHPRASDPGIFASDLMHANARGHAIAFAAIVRALAEETNRRQ